MIPSINREWRSEWVWGSRSSPPGKTVKRAITAAYTNTVIPAQPIPLPSFSPISPMVPVSTGPHGPRRGSTSLSVTRVPMTVISTVDATMKYQLQTGSTVYSGSIMRAAWVDMPANMGSLVPIKRLALQPPDTPAKAAASPAAG